jgi:hypothetical protein
MATRNFKTSSIKNGITVGGRTTFWDQISVIPSSSFESIQSTTLSTTTASISFTSIPATYTHLQIRGIGKSTRIAAYDNIKIQFNGDTATGNYTSHYIQGDRTNVALAQYPQNIASAGVGTVLADDSTNASNFGSFVIDILDYTNTNKYKTTRTLGGNTVTGAVGLSSGLWNSSSAITSILIGALNGNLKTYTSIALYGIKVA